MKHIELIKNTNRFCLHDSKISQMEFVDRNLILTFSEGFWETNESGKLIKRRNNCRITYKFLVAEDEELNLYIFKETFRKRKEVKFADFSEIVNKHGFIICLEFRSDFSKQLILQGNTDKANYSITTEEIEEIVYEYDDD